MWIYLITALLLQGTNGCSKSGGETPVGATPPTNQTDSWIIPQDKVLDGGPGKDGIPSVDEPKFSTVSNIDFLEPEELVIGVHVDGKYKAYPHAILDWHEIVNDEVGDKKVAITYCPLTGTGIGWDREVGGELTTFGVSGLLYNSNLIPYDRKTDSNWSQMLLQSVQGDHAGLSIETIPVLETSWLTWKTMYPDSEVMTLETGFNRDYNRYPYGDFKTNHDFLIFSVEPDDDRLPRKQRGLGVLIDRAQRFYSLQLFEEPRVIHDTLGTVRLIVVGSEEHNFVMAFENVLADGTRLQFETQDDLTGASVMMDQNGTGWNLFGVAISGPGKGTRLTPVTAFMGYWFAWGAFYPDIEIYGDN